jgi:hypothetical protein
MELGGLPAPQFLPWRRMVVQDPLWQSQFWVSPLGELPDVVSWLIDVAHPILKIGLEADGRSHLYKGEADEVRDQWLMSHGWLVLRFSNEEITTSIDSVVQTVETAVRSRSTT